MKIPYNVAAAILRASAKNDWSDLINESIATLENVAMSSYERNLPEHIVNLGINVGKIFAVKQLRGETGFSLAVAVDILTRHFEQNKLKFKGHV